MPDLDLTEAVDAAARRYLAMCPPTAPGSPDSLMQRHVAREFVTPLVAAAAPLIAAQARRAALLDAVEYLEREGNGAALYIFTVAALRHMIEDEATS